MPEPQSQQDQRAKSRYLKRVNYMFLMNTPKIIGRAAFLIHILEICRKNDKYSLTARYFTAFYRGLAIMKAR